MSPFDLNQRLQNALPPTPPAFSDAVRRGLARAAAGERPRVPVRRRRGMWAALAACCVLAVAFGGMWTANPAMADGISFRQGIISFFNGDKKEVQLLVEPPIATGQGVRGQLPKAEIGAYEVTLAETVFDGNNLYLGYTLRMRDGSALPDQSLMYEENSPPEGEVRVEGLRIDGTDDFFSAPMRSSTLYLDPFEVHTSLEVELDGLLAQHEVTDQSNLELLLSNYAHEVKPDGGDSAQINSILLDEASITFRVSTANRDAAVTLVPLQTRYDMDGWTLEILRVELSPLITRLHYRASGPVSMQDQAIGGIGKNPSFYQTHQLLDEAGNAYHYSGGSSSGTRDGGRFTREGTLDFDSLKGPSGSLTLTFEAVDLSTDEQVKLPDLYQPIQIQLPPCDRTAGQK